MEKRGGGGTKGQKTLPRKTIAVHNLQALLEVSLVRQKPMIDLEKMEPVYD
jgi:hypothetical protein